METSAVLKIARFTDGMCSLHWPPSLPLTREGRIWEQRSSTRPWRKIWAEPRHARVRLHGLCSVHCSDGAVGCTHGEFVRCPRNPVYRLVAGCAWIAPAGDTCEPGVALCRRLWVSAGRGLFSRIHGCGAVVCHALVRKEARHGSGPRPCGGRCGWFDFRTVVTQRYRRRARKLARGLVLPFCCRVAGALVSILFVKNRPEEVGQVADGGGNKAAKSQAMCRSALAVYRTRDHWTVREAMRHPRILAAHSGLHRRIRSGYRDHRPCGTAFA